MLNFAVVSLEPSQKETLNPMHTPLLFQGSTRGCQFKSQIWAQISKFIPAAIAAYCWRYLTFGPALFFNILHGLGIDLASSKTHVLSSLFMLRAAIKSNCLFFSSRQCVGCFPWRILCWSPNLASAQTGKYCKSNSWHFLVVHHPCKWPCSSASHVTTNSVPAAPENSLYCKSWCLPSNFNAQELLCSGCPSLHVAGGPLKQVALLYHAHYSQFPLHLSV